MKYIRRVLIELILLMMLVSQATGEKMQILQSFEAWLSPSPAPVKASLTADLRQWPVFDEERTEHMNRMLSHLSLKMHAGESVRGISLLCDRKEVFTLLTETGTDGDRAWFSEDPYRVYHIPSGEAVPGQAEQIQHFLNISEDLLFLMKEMLPYFASLPDRYPDLVKESKITLQYKGYGKAVRKAAMVFSADMIGKMDFQSVFDGVEGNHARSFLQSLIISGKQRITLLYDAEGNVIKINYDGDAGKQEDDMRAVSVDWRCLREDDKIKDTIRIKTPAVKGAKRNNLVLESTLTRDENGTESLNILTDYDENNQGDKRRITGEASLQYSDEILTGSVVTRTRHSGTQTSVTLKPEITLGTGGIAQGKIRIEAKAGKTVSVDADIGFSLARGNALSFPETDDLAEIRMDGPESSAYDELSRKAAHTLLEALAQIPENDLIFLTEGFSEDQWNTIKGMF